MAAKLFGEFLEGSILDFQLGDLFSHCNAGDIRISFEAANPKSLSIIAEVQNDVNLVPHVTSRGFDLSLIEVGDWSISQLMENEIWRQQLTIYLLRFISVLFVLVVLRWTAMDGQFWGLTLLSTAFLSGTVIALDKLLVWGWSVLSFVVFIAGLIGTMWTLQQRVPVDVDISNKRK